MPSDTHARTPPFTSSPPAVVGIGVLAARFGGALFVLNFAGATALGLALLSPLERWFGHRRGALLSARAALGGVALAATAFVFLAVSEHTTLFGFHEPGYDPTAIAATRVAEIATVALLGVHLLAQRRSSR